MRVRISLLVLVGVGAAARLAFLGAIPVIVTPDGSGYYAVATHLWTDAGAWFDPWRAPGYPLFLSVVMRLFGDRPETVIATQSVLGLAAVLVYYGLARAVGSHVVGLIVATFVALNPAFIVFEHSLLSETLSLLVRGIAIWAVVGAIAPRMTARSGLSAGIAAGMGLGACVLVRPSDAVLIAAAVAFAIIVGAQAVRRRDVAVWRRTVRTGAVMVVAAVVLLLPPLTRNAIVEGSPRISGAANIARFIFALTEGFIAADDPELVRLVPALPAACSQDPRGCGWLAIEAVRQRVGAEHEVDAWARRFVQARVSAAPLRFARAVAWATVKQTGVIAGRWTDVDFFVTTVAVEPAVYGNAVATADLPPWARGQRMPAEGGAARRTLARLYTSMFAWRTPAVWAIFLIGLPWAIRRPGLVLIGLMALATTASLSLLLAPVDRYMLLAEPLQLVFGLGGLAVLVGSRQAAAARAHPYALEEGDVQS